MKRAIFISCAVFFGLGIHSQTPPNLVNVQFGQGPAITVPTPRNVENRTSVSNASPSEQKAKRWASYTPPNGGPVSYLVTVKAQ